MDELPAMLSRAEQICARDLGPLLSVNFFFVSVLLGGGKQSVDQIKQMECFLVFSSDMD